MEMTDKQIIDKLLYAAKLAEATLMKIKPNTVEERVWAIDAQEELGKAIASEEWRRVKA